jgi:hypothetical protein
VRTTPWSTRIRASFVNVNSQLSSDRGQRPDYDSTARRLQAAATHSRRTVITSACRVLLGASAPGGEAAWVDDSKLETPATSRPRYTPRPAMSASSKPPLHRRFLLPNLRLLAPAHRPISAAEPTAPRTLPTRQSAPAAAAHAHGHPQHPGAWTEQRRWRPRHPPACSRTFAGRWAASAGRPGTS